MHPERMARGIHHGRAKLNDDTVREIRASYTVGLHSLSDMARQYGVGRTTISNIAKGRRWKHVLTGEAVI